MPSPDVRQPGRARTVFAEIRIDAFPVVVTKRGSRVLGSLAVFFGGSFTVFPVIGLIMAAREPIDQDFYVAAGAFGVVFLLFLALALWGVNQFVSREILTIDSSSVGWQRRSLFRTREHVEPLGAFEGVIYRRDWNSEDGSTSHLELLHRDPASTVTLYRANRDYDIPEKWRRYCEALSVPAIQRLSPDRTVTRPVDSLDETLVTLVRDGRLVLPEAEWPPPSEISAERRGEGHDAVVVLELPGKKRVSLVAEGILVETPGLLGGQRRYDSDRIESFIVETWAPRRQPTLVMTFGTPLAESQETLHLDVALGAGLDRSTLDWLMRFFTLWVARVSRWPAHA